MFILSSIVLLVGVAANMAFGATAALRINALDASTGKAVPLTNVTIYGPRNLDAVVDYSGNADFVALPAGEYSVEIRRYGYKPTKIAPVQLTDGQDLVLDVRLVPTGLKIIATVTARETPQASTEVVNADDTAAQLDSSLLTALNSLPSVTFGPGASPSIRGRPANQVGATINGVPVSLFGSPPNIGALNADLFSSASIDPSDASGNAGGTIDFETRSPTLAWLGTLREITMSHNGTDFAASEEGTAGIIGISYTHAQRTSPDALDGRKFLDTSGLDYPHAAAESVRGDALELRYPLSSHNVLLASSVSIDAFQPFVCRNFTGRLPCGYGPTNAQRTRLRSMQLRDTTRLGKGWVTATLFSNSTKIQLDQSGFYADGVHEPSASAASAHTDGVMLHGGVSLGRSHARNLEFKAAFFKQSTTSIGSAFGSIEPPLLSRLSFVNFDVKAPLITARRLSSSLEIGGEHWQSDVADTGAHMGLLLSYRVMPHDTVSFDVASGTATGPTASFAGVSPATLLQFNCDGNVALGTGPSKGATGSRSFETKLDWMHSAARWSAQLELYNQVQTNAPLTAVVGASELNSSLFPPNYLLQATQAQHNACGGNATVGLSNLFYTVSGIADRAWYQGVNLSAVLSPSKHLALRMSYALTRAAASGNDSLLFGPLSTVIAEQQLPQVPLHTADFAAAADVGRAGIKLLFEASGTSSNNAYNLPGYVTLNAGAFVPTQHGQLAITVTNVANRYPGPFASTAHAIALPMTVGAFPTVAQPLIPRTIAVGYRFHVGPPEFQPTFNIDETQFEPNYSGVGGGSFAIPLFAGRPQAHPFEVNPQSPGCGPEDLQTARRILAALKAYVRRIEHAKTYEGYPETFPPQPVDALVLEYQRVGASYAVLVATSAADTKDLNDDILPVNDCGFEYAVGKEQAHLSNLYMTDESGRWLGPGHAGGVLLAYMPQVGLYPPPPAFEEQAPPPHPKIENVHFWDYVDAPAVTPRDAFALRRGADCSPEIEPAAADVLKSLQAYVHAYFDVHQHPADPPGLRIFAHKAPGGTWLEIRTEDLEALSNLTQCMNVFDMPRKTIESDGYGGELPPELSYAPRFGLYVLDP